MDGTECSVGVCRALHGGVAVSSSLAKARRAVGMVTAQGCCPALLVAPRGLGSRALPGEHRAEPTVDPIGRSVGRRQCPSVGTVAEGALPPKMDRCGWRCGPFAPAFPGGAAEWELRSVSIPPQTPLSCNSSAHEVCLQLPDASRGEELRSFGAQPWVCTWRSQVNIWHCWGNFRENEAQLLPPSPPWGCCSSLSRSSQGSLHPHFFPRFQPFPPCSTQPRCPHGSALTPWQHPDPMAAPRPHSSTLTPWQRPNPIAARSAGLTQRALQERDFKGFHTPNSSPCTPWLSRNEKANKKKGGEKKAPVLLCPLQVTPLTPLPPQLGCAVSVPPIL